MATATRRAAVVAAILGAMFGTPAESRAEPRAIPVRVDTRAAEACTDDAAFLRELGARDARMRPAGAGERAPALVIVITRAGQTVHGRLEVEDIDGFASRREVDGDGCGSVLNALALMAVLAVDPTAPRTLGDASSAGPRSGGDPASSGAARSGGDPTVPAPSTSPDPSGPNHVDRSAETAMLASDAEPDHAGGYRLGSGLRLAFTAGAGATMGTAPAVSWMVPVAVEIGWGGVTKVSPLLRAGFVHADSGQDAATGGDARFVLNEGTLDACASVPVTRGLSLAPCLRVEAGALGAAGSNIQPALGDTRPWLGLGAIGTARYLVLSPFFVELSLGVRVPLVRDRFFFAPDTTVFTPPVLAGVGAGSIGITIL